MEVPCDILTRYFERRQRDLDVCRQSLKKHNFVELEKVGHQLKGNGETFGHPELSKIGKLLEDAAATCDRPNVEKAVNELSKWVTDHTV